MILIITFSDGNTITIKQAEYIPNLGESIHNEKDAMSRYYVTKKDIFYYPDLSMTNIVISADKKP